MELWHHGVNPCPELVISRRRHFYRWKEKKFVDEATEQLMNILKGLSQESTKEQALADEEMLEEQIYEESYQEDPDEVSHVEDLDETFVSMLPLDEDEVFLPHFPPRVISIKEKSYHEVYQPLEEEQELPHEGLIEEVSPQEEEHELPHEYVECFNDLIHEEDLHEDEVLVSSLPFDEDIQASVPPAHQEENMISYNPFKNFDDTLFHDFGSEEVLEEPLDATDPLCNDVIENIDDFIHVGRHAWDVDCFGFDGDPIYDIEGSFQIRNTKVFPLEGCFSYMDHPTIWHPDDNMSIDWSHPFKDDLSQCTHDDFRSYFESCDVYPFEHSDSLCGENFHPPSCSNLDKDKTMANPERSETHATKQSIFILGLLAGICR
jgi:hypothetical protein